VVIPSMTSPTTLSGKYLARLSLPTVQASLKGLQRGNYVKNPICDGTAHQEEERAPKVWIAL